MRRAHVPARVGFALLLGVVATACAGSSTQVPLREAPWVTVQIELQPDGDARVSLLSSGMGFLALRTLTAQTAAAVFPDARVQDAPRVLTVDPSRADALGNSAVMRGELDVPGAFAPGSAPQLHVDGPALDRALRREGVVTRWLSLCLPPVPAEQQVTPPVASIVSEGCRLYVASPGEGLPAVAVTMHPQPLRWVAGVLGVLLALALAASALVSRARRGRGPRTGLPVGLALASLGVLALTAAVAAQGQTHAALAGFLGAPTSTAPVWTLAKGAGVAAAILACVALGWSMARRGRPSEPEAAEPAPSPADPSVPVH